VEVFNSKMLVYGGSNGQVLNDIWEFDSESCTWARIQIPKNSDEPNARAKHGGVAYQNLLFIHGGISGAFRESDLWCLTYSTETKKGYWTKLLLRNNNFPVPRDSHTISLIGKHIYLFGGNGKGTYFNDLWKFNIEELTEPVRSNNGLPGKPITTKLEIPPEEETSPKHTEGENPELQMEPVEQIQTMEESMATRLDEGFGL
jgi:hypothetical protein